LRGAREFRALFATLALHLVGCSTPSADPGEETVATPPTAATATAPLSVLPRRSTAPRLGDPLERVRRSLIVIGADVQASPSILIVVPDPTTDHFLRIFGPEGEKDDP